MGKVLERKFRFKNHNDGKTRVKFPTKEDVLILKQRAESYNDPDEMMDVYDWDGGCWHTLFDLSARQAKEHGMDEWDVFACLLHNFIFEKGGDKE